MEPLTNSRFITYPSTVEKSSNHTVVVVDATPVDIEDIGLFCKVANKNYDIYLYPGSIGDLEWLCHVAGLADYVLIKESSEVYTHGVNTSRKDNLLEYFQDFDHQY